MGTVTSSSSDPRSSWSWMQVGFVVFMIGLETMFYSILRNTMCIVNCLKRYIFNMKSACCMCRWIVWLLFNIRCEYKVNFKLQTLHWINKEVRMRLLTRVSEVVPVTQTFPEGLPHRHAGDFGKAGNSSFRRSTNDPDLSFIAEILLTETFIDWIP